MSNDLKAALEAAGLEVPADVDGEPEGHVTYPVVECRATYEEVAKFQQVRVKVPSEGCPHMSWIDMHQMDLPNGENVSVDGHYKHGQVAQAGVTHPKTGEVLEPTIYMNRNFFIPEHGWHGAVFCAEVKVMRKSYPDGRSFIFLDIRPIEGGCRPTHELKIKETRVDPSDIAIDNTMMYLHLQPIKQRPRKDIHIETAEASTAVE